MKPEKLIMFVYQKVLLTVLPHTEKLLIKIRKTWNLWISENVGIHQIKVKMIYVVFTVSVTIVLAFNLKRIMKMYNDIGFILFFGRKNTSIFTILLSFFMNRIRCFWVLIQQFFIRWFGHQIQSLLSILKYQF